jgi:hypothetical protein
VTVEANAATDNPMVFADTGDIVSGGNFHGAPVALAADLLAIGAHASCAPSANGARSGCVNPALSGTAGVPGRSDGGLQSGLMLAQVTAAALTSEVKTLASRLGVDTIPTSANKEDHVSMSMGAALKAARALSSPPRARRRDPVRRAGDRPARAAHRRRRRWGACTPRCGPWCRRSSTTARRRPTSMRSRIDRLGCGRVRGGHGCQLISDRPRFIFI